MLSQIPDHHVTPHPKDSASLIHRVKLWLFTLIRLTYLLSYNGTACISSKFQTKPTGQEKMPIMAYHVFSNYGNFYTMLSQEERGHARERGSVGPCGEEFSAGLIFLCFVSFHLRKRNEEDKRFFAEEN
ncbi:hypothetical protein [Cyclobacterium marinum]|uniref:Uncharacterized protein n=1 Tax=Cyclobacterium marinum (strain ATCC 25205 / DSM 745 / LMG 13164 / NCIMB 1802) TaxID=880070 RepID=G0J1F9_CYCMS|nr:hypothetical protein [Cyclobacterium marinum]AEL27354.1 hypothetical protein Cycma_3639 [Cyclobacterium marinum DSM 745]